MVKWRDGEMVLYNQQYLLAFLGIVLALICAVEELSIEQLDANHSKNELKEDVDNQNIENIL